MFATQPYLYIFLRAALGTSCCYFFILSPLSVLRVWCCSFAHLKRHLNVCKHLPNQVSAFLSIFFEFHLCENLCLWELEKHNFLRKLSPQELHLLSTFNHASKWQLSCEHVHDKEVRQRKYRYEIKGKVITSLYLK